jgi:HSP20 family protein
MSARDRRERAIFNELQREVGRVLQSLEPLAGWRTLQPWPPVNLLDLGDAFLVQAAVPGMHAGEIDVSIVGDTLTLRGERRRREGVGDEHYRRQERPFGRWARAITLPERVDGDGVLAECAAGVLTIRLPRCQDARPRRIAVAGGPADIESP